MVSAFNFSDSSFHQWPTLLSQYRHQETICSPVFWGAHEQLRGTRDFYRSPRLNLEKYLSLLHEKAIKTEVLIGFFPSEETFPEWTLSLVQKDQVAECFWNPESAAFSVKEIPSLANPDLADGFCAFAEDLLTQLALYRAPDGPVEKVSLDLIAYSRCWSAGEIPEFSRWLEKEYGSLKTLNQIFQTSFSSFDGLRVKTGIRALSDKRAWILGRSYKRFREEKLDAFRSRFLTLPTLEPMKDIFSFCAHEGTAPGEFSWVIDDALFDWGSRGEPIPLCPWGVVSNAGAAAFRTAEYFHSYAVKHGIPFVRLPEEGSPVERGTWGIIASKYLSENSLSLVFDFLEKGGKVFFPFGLPQYTEKLAQIKWDFSKSILKEESGLRIHHRGKGRVFESAKGIAVSDSLNEELSELLERVRDGRD